MIYYKSHIASCARMLSAVFPVALIIGGLIFLSRLLAESVSNAFPISSLWQFLLLTLVKYTPQLLTISLFASILMAIERAYNTREMTAWFAAGIGLRHFTLPGLILAIPVIFIIAVFAFAFTPWSVRSADIIQLKLISDIKPENLRGGEFGAVPGGGYTYFFADNPQDDNNIFIARNNTSDHEIITAQNVRRQQDEFITLENGTFYRLPAIGAPEIINFYQMQIHLPSQQIEHRRLRGLPLSELQWQSPPARAELIWRISQPLAALFFVLTATWLGQLFARSRQRQSFFIALLLFAIYLNLMYFARDQLANNTWHFIPGLMLPPLAVSAIMWLILRATKQ